MAKVGTKPIKCLIETLKGVDGFYYLEYWLHEVEAGWVGPFFDKAEAETAARKAEELWLEDK